MEGNNDGGLALLVSPKHFRRLTNCAEQSSPWEVDSRSAVQEIIYPSRRAKFVIVFKRFRHWTLSWVSWIQSTKLCFVIIPPSTPRSL